MKREPLDIYDEKPPEMKAYLRNWGWSFSRKACECAVKEMRRINAATGKKEVIEPYSKSQAEEFLTKYGVKIEHNKGYDFVYVLNMCRADYLKSGVQTRQIWHCLSKALLMTLTTRAEIGLENGSLTVTRKVNL